MKKIRKFLSQNKIIYTLWEHAYREILRKRAIRKGKRLSIEKNKNIIAFDHIGAKFYLPKYKTDLIQQSILVYEQYYEQRYLDYIFGEWHDGIVGRRIKNKTVLDIGSNIGSHSLYFKKVLKTGTVYAFEPIKDTYEILSNNMKINNIDDCILYNKGIGSSNSKASIASYDERNTGGATIIGDISGSIDIITIDSLHIDDEVGFIKIDTEGFEKEVIDGANELISKNKPFIMVEISPKNFDYISKKLMGMGYEYLKYDNENCFFYNPKC